MTSQIHELTAFQRDLLYVVSGLHKPSGQQILSIVQPVYEDDITGGRLYPNLDTLVHKGLVEKGELDRRTNYYDISSDGEEAIEERRAWESKFVGE